MSRFPFRPFLSRWIDRVTVLGSRFRFGGSRAYWESRYRLHGSSGAGSYGQIARQKAEFLNEFCRANSIAEVLEFGCGDGAQLELAKYPAYTGVDVSRSAIRRCENRFSEDDSKQFYPLDQFPGQRTELVLSLDVIYHLVEDDVFLSHLDALFRSARRFVVIFSTNHEDANDRTSAHVRHRAFVPVCARRFDDFELIRRPEQESGADHAVAGFYVFRRRHPEG